MVKCAALCSQARGLSRNLIDSAEIMVRPQEGHRAPAPWLIWQVAARGAPIAHARELKKLLPQSAWKIWGTGERWRSKLQNLEEDHILVCLRSQFVVSVGMDWTPQTLGLAVRRRAALYHAVAFLNG